MQGSAAQGHRGQCVCRQVTQASYLPIQFFQIAPRVLPLHGNRPRVRPRERYVAAAKSTIDTTALVHCRLFWSQH